MAVLTLNISQHEHIESFKCSMFCLCVHAGSRSYHNFIVYPFQRMWAASTSVSMQLEYSDMDMWGTHATYCACERKAQAMLECQCLCSYARAMGFRLLDQQWGSGKVSYTRMCTWKPKDQSCSPWQHVLYGNMYMWGTHATYCASLEHM